MSKEELFKKYQDEAKCKYEEVTLLKQDYDAMVEREELLRQQLADLEAKLAESEKKAYSRGHSQRDIANEIKLNALREDVANKEKRIVELKKQLAEKEKEKEKEKSLSIKSVVRTLMKDNNLNCTFRDKTNAQIQQCGDVYNSNYGYFNFEDDYDESLNNKNDNRFDITSIDLTNQDKISFCIEQLEQIRKEFEIKFKGCKWEDKMLVGKFCNITNETIDNQINVLRHNKDGIHKKRNL